MNYQQQGELFWEAHLYLRTLIHAQIKNYEKRELVLTLLEEDACEILINFPDIDPPVFFKLLIELYKMKSGDSFLNSTRYQTNFFKVVIKDDNNKVYRFPGVCLSTVLKSRYNESLQERAQRLIEVGKEVIKSYKLPDHCASSIESYLHTITGQYYFLDEEDIGSLVGQLIPLANKNHAGIEALETIRLTYSKGELSLYGYISQNPLP